jgi:hypothetical protein
MDGPVELLSKHRHNPHGNDPTRKDAHDPAASDNTPDAE